VRSRQLWGGEAVTFDEIFEQALEMLQRRGRVSYRALKVQFQLDDDLLDLLRDEIVEVHQLARDQEGKMLVWTGDTAAASALVSRPAPDYARRPLTYTPPYLTDKILAASNVLEGERKQVTVLFADLKGSLELLADRDPEEARQLLDPVLERMMAAVHRYEGTANQIMGDGIMALFGAPIAHEDHAVRACYAALAMQAALRRYGDEVRRTHGLAVHLRIGLNAGEVVVRSISNDLHMDYSAIGQTVHLAARMEQLATPGCVLLTAATLRLAEGLVRVQPLGPIPVKGLAGPVEVYELVGASALRGRIQTRAAGGLSRFVGRDMELAALRQALEHAGAGHGQVVALVGEAGVGKSRLVYEFVHAHDTQGWRVLESTSVSYDKATPYFPVVDLLKRYTHVEDADELRTVRAKVTGQVLTLDETLQETILALLWLLDALPDDSPFHTLEASQRRQRTLEALKRVLLRESQVQPLLLVFEDLHWIDAETQALLDSLIESLPTARLLLLVNYRPEYQHSWGGKTYYTQLRLDPLPPASTAAVLQALLGADPSLAPLTPLLIARTEGNPFFLEESVRTLVETQALVGEPGAYRLAQTLPTIHVPATVQAMLAARIDRLPAEEKRLLQNAAVIGMEVPLTLLQAIAEASDEALRAGLARLQAAEFLFETRLFPVLEYTFTHALTHEVAYGSLLQERRRVLHARVAEAIEALAGDRLAEQIERLAHHAVRGEVWEKVVRYAHQAGTRAADRSAYGQAGAFFDQALDALAHLPESQATMAQAFDLHKARASMHAARRELEPLLACSEKIWSLAEALGDPHRLAYAVDHMGNALSQMGDNVRALEYAQRGLALAETVGAVDLLVHIRLNMGILCRTMGDYRRGATVLTQAVELLQGRLARERFGRPLYPAVVARQHLATCLSALGEFRQALSTAEEGLQIAQTLQQSGNLLMAYLSYGEPLLHQGQFHDAVPRLEHAMALYTPDLSAWYPMTAGALGFAYAMTGRLAEALPLLEQAVERAQHVDRRRETQWLTYLSEAYLRAGRPDDAHAAAERLLALGRERGERGTEARGRYLLGEIATEREPPHTEEAEAHYRKALALAEALGMRPLKAHCHQGLGTLYAKTGQAEQARTELTAAINLYRAMDMTFWLPQTEVALAQVAR
jgi:class 3 adenylate cyclase/tetratricopeptide (TPR) repeat protein